MRGVTFVLAVGTMMTSVTPAAGQGVPRQPPGRRTPPYAPGQVIVMTEPNVFSLPPGLARAPAGRVSVALARVQEVFARRRVSAVARAVPTWDSAAPYFAGRRVYARRKHELMPPGALADLSQLYLLEFPDTENVDSVVAELNRAPGIVYAEPNRLIHALSVPPSTRLSTGMLLAAKASTPND